MFPQSRHSASSQSSQPLKFTTSDSCDRIKDEFQFLQAQYHSLKMECDKLASEKSEMQRHYIMYYEMSYGLNIEMHKQVTYFLSLTLSPSSLSGTVLYGKASVVF